MLSELHDEVKHEAKDNALKKLIEWALEMMQKTDKEAGDYDEEGSSENPLAESSEHETGIETEEEKEAETMGEGMAGEEGLSHDEVKNFMKKKTNPIKKGIMMSKIDVIAKPKEMPFKKKR